MKASWSFAFVLAVVLSCSAVASAATGFGKVASFGAGEFPEGPGALAVSQSTGDVYVVDHGNQEVHRYDGTDKAPPLGSWAVAAPAGVVVDNSNGASAGDVYVLSNAEGAVAIDKFDGEGKPLGEIAETEPGTPFTGLSGVAVDKEGDLWVQQSSGEVDKFDNAEANTFVSAVFTAPEPPCTGAMAIDEAEHLYLPIGCGVEQFNTTGEDQGQLDPNFVAGVTAEPETNHVFADDGFQVSIYDEARDPLATFGGGVLSGCSAGIGIDHSSQHVYVADPCNGLVFVFAQVTLPTVTIEAPTGITSTHADFSGTVNPEGEGLAHVTTWHFEYSADGGKSWTPTTGGQLEPGSEAVAVHDEATLVPNESVQVRLAASDAGGTSTSGVEELKTPAIAPTITDNTPIFNLTPTGAVLHGNLNDFNAKMSDCHFEYGTTIAYGHVIGCDQPPPAGLDPVGVSGSVSDLAPGTTYHFRLDGTSIGGSAQGDDASFTTPNPQPETCSNAALRQGASARLPDCRAFEQVSPVDKRGGDVTLNPSLTRVSSAGDAATFASTTALGDARGIAVQTEYMALRGSGGWTTHGLYPPVPPIDAQQLSSGFLPSYVLMGGNLQYGVFRDPYPLTDDPNVAQLPNFYRRDDLRSPGPGSYQLLTACPGCVSPLQFGFLSLGSAVQLALPVVDGASADGSQVIFTSRQQLTSDAPGDCAGSNIGDESLCPRKLYEWNQGTVTLAGILPDGSPAAASDAGQGGSPTANENPHSTPHTISADGTRVIFTDPTTGNLYERINSSSTIQLNASEKTNGSGPGGSDVSGAGRSRYMDASSDGTRVFFTSSEALTDDAPEATTAAAKLYLYDAGAPEGQRLDYIHGEVAGSASSVIEAIGASADGHSLYFISGDRWVSNQPTSTDFLQGALNIFLWHDGQVRFVAFVDAESIFVNSNTANAVVGEGFREARVSPDGAHLLFATGQVAPFGPTGYHSSQLRQVYLYDASNNALDCASCNPSGATATASASTAVTPAGLSEKAETAESVRPLSRDGRYVFFTTAEKLVPLDTNGVSDAYEFDSQTGRIHLLSSGVSPNPSSFVNASADGTDALLLTTQSLVGQDSDGSVDLYDARIGGGIAAQDQPPPAPPCTDSDGCQGALSETAPPAAPGSATFVGPPDLTPVGGPAAAGGNTIKLTRATGKGSKLTLTVSVPAKGRLVATGAGLKPFSRMLSKPGSYRIVVGLTRAERRLLQRRRSLTLKVRLEFSPTGGRSSSIAVSVRAKA